MQTAAEGTLRKDRQISKHAWFYVIPKKRFFFCRFLRQDGIFEVFFLVFCGSDFASFSFLSIFCVTLAPWKWPIFGGGHCLGEASVSWGASGGLEVLAKRCNSNVLVVSGRWKLFVKLLKPIVIIMTWFSFFLFFGILSHRISCEKKYHDQG